MTLVFYCRYGEICFYHFLGLMTNFLQGWLGPGTNFGLPRGFGLGSRCLFSISVRARSLPSLAFVIIDSTYASFSPFTACPSDLIIPAGGLGGNKLRDNRIPRGGWIPRNKSLDNYKVMSFCLHARVREFIIIPVKSKTGAIRRRKAVGSILDSQLPQI